MTFSFKDFFFLILTWPLLHSCGSGTPETQTISTPKDTLQWLQENLKAHPDSMKPRVELSNWLKRRGSLDSALIPLDEGLRMDSTLTVLHNLKALLLLEKGDSTAAIRSLVQSINLQPEQTDVHLELGFIYAAQKNKSALTVADFLLSQSQDDPNLQSQSRYLKGVYYTNMGMRKEAMNMYDEIIQQNYTFLDAYLEKGILQYEDKQFNEALKTFDKVLTISNTNPEAYLWTGKCLEALGRKNEALDFYKKTVGLNAGLKEAEEAVARLGGN